MLLLMQPGLDLLYPSTAPTLFLSWSCFSTQVGYAM